MACGHYKAWTAEDEERLIEMLGKGVDLLKIARSLKRTREATAARRLKLQREGRCATRLELAGEG